MTDAITGTTSGNAPAKSTGTDNFGSGMGKDTFLKLLVAQLKYQNPLQPTDGQQYMAQMAQFTTVEKLADIQKSQTDLAGWQRTVAGQGMVGKEITASLASGGEATGKVTGLRLTDAGPRLVLENGTTVSVDEVTDVRMPSGSATAAPAPAPAASAPAPQAPAAGTPTAQTPATQTPAAGTPTAQTPTAPTAPPATTSTSGGAAGTSGAAPGTSTTAGSGGTGGTTA